MMKITDFKTLEDVNKHSNGSFCQNCLDFEPEDDEGYTECCNEPCVDKKEAIMLAKRYDIQNYLHEHYSDVGSHLPSGQSRLVRFEIDGKDVDLSMNLSPEDLALSINNIKK